MTSIPGSHDSFALSLRCRPARPRAAAVGLSAAALILVAACSSGGSASTPMTPRQALLAAATQAQKVTSATETLTVKDTGASPSTTTGTIQFRLKPTLLISGDLDATAAGTTTRVKMVITGTAIYFSEPSVTSQLGKPWVSVDLSSLAGTSGAGLAQLVQTMHSNTFTSQARAYTAAQDTRVVGEQTVGGVSTTEYAGSVKAAAALKAMPASLRQALAPELQALGNTTIYFREWIDGQHHLRKMAVTETLNGDTIDTTINVTAVNQPVSITPPPASQTYTLQPDSAGSGSSGTSGLGAKVVPAPSGFALSQGADASNGPISAADFNQNIGGGGNPAATLHFDRGYEVTYDSTSNSDRIVVFVFQFATASDATLFKTGSLSAAPGKPKADPLIPGADYFDARSPSGGMYDHGVIGSKGNFVFVIDDATGSAAPVPLVETMARQQYAAL
jgi:hypothetical protein